MRSLSEELERGKSDNKRLRELIGSWRRKVEEKGPRRECLREGYHHDRGKHYKVYVVTDIPGDLPISAVIACLKEDFLKTVLPYTFIRCDYSTKYKGWLVEVDFPMHFDMSISEI